jgi:O-antigen/teichoic acid export membrane protein
MRRFFARNLLFVLTVNLLVKPAWIFLIDRTVQNKVGHSSYGIYQALVNLGIVFQILLDFGINNFNSTSLAEDPKQINKLFPAMLSARVVLSGLYFIAVTIIALLLGYRGWQIFLLLGILLVQSTNSVLQFIRSNVNGLHHFKTDGVLSVIDRFLMIVICGVLFLLPATKDNFKIEWFVAAQIVAYTIAILIGFILLRRFTKVNIRFSFHGARVYSIISQSLPYALLIFLMSIYTRVDMMLVERLCGENGSEQAGIYAASYRLLDVGNMFGLMFASMLLPVFKRMLSKGSDVMPIVQLSLNVLLPVSLLVSVVGVFFGDEIMHTLYKHTTETDVKVFTWLMLAFPAFSISNVYSTLLTSNGNLKLLNTIAFVGVLLNLGLNFWLIPQQLSLGAATTAFITQTILALLFLYFAHQQTKLPFNIKRTFAFGFYLVIIVGLGFFMKGLNLALFTRLICLFGGGVLLILAFRFLSIKALLQLMQKEE